MILRKRPNILKFSRLYSAIERLKSVGIAENEANKIIELIDEEVNKVTNDLADSDDLKRVQSDFEEKLVSASTFVTSTSPFQLNFSSNLIISNPSTALINSFPSVVDPSLLEKEIKITGQQLTDEIKQLQADHLLDSNLEAKRREQVDLELEAKLEASSRYAEERISQLNEHLDRVSRQALTAIGGTIHYMYFIKHLLINLGFIGILTAVFISYSLLSN